MGPEDKGGMSGYVAPVARKKGKKAKAAKAAKSKADYRPGGMYSTGRAIPPSPGTKKATTKTPLRSADAYGSPKLKHVAAPGFSKAIKGIGKVVSNVASNIQNKSGAAKKTNTPTMAQAYKAAAKPKGGSGSKKK